MTLIKSIFGIRGTIGGRPGQALTPMDIVSIAGAFGMWLQNSGANKKLVIGRDARISGEMVNQLVVGSLISVGVEVIILEQVRRKFSDYPSNTIDRLKITFLEGWVHMRKSNTEQIIRIYAEATTEKYAKDLAECVKQLMKVTA